MSLTSPILELSGAVTRFFLFSPFNAGIDLVPHNTVKLHCERE